MAHTQESINAVFVDDDIAAISRLEQQMRSKVPSWNLRFFTSAQEALDSCEKEGRPQVVVTDLRMPEIDGATLLENVKAAYPETIRMVCSDYEDVPVALRSVPVAHQFLASPIDIDGLIDLISRDVELQGRIHNPKLADLVASIDLLPSPPSSVIEINRLVTDPFATVEAVAEAIRLDSAMSAKLLQLVNSAFFGLSTHVEDVQQAVALLGFDTVRNLLIAVELVRSFTNNSPDLERAVEDINTHSYTVAELSRSLMARRKGAHEAFVAGMLHDIGLLALIACAPDKYREIVARVEDSTQSVEECEEQILGTTHASIGAYLLGLWGLPFSMIEAVARSHDADVLNDTAITPVHAVFISERISNVLGTTNKLRESNEMPPDAYLAQLEITETVEGIIGKVPTRSKNA